MANVSKNIRRLRTEKTWTQAQLAEQIHVTRQTVSGWETGRTQPDIEMLTLLASALDADIEDLIYGKKRRTAPVDPAPARRRAMTAALSVLGSLFVAAGLILIFIHFWQDLGGILKAVLAFLPLLAGGATGLVAVFSKKQTTTRREFGAVLWIAGALATNALINGIFRLGFGFGNLLLADLLLTLPIMFLLQSVFACTATLVMSAAAVLDGDFLSVAEPFGKRLAFALFIAAVLGITALFVRKNRLPDGLKKYAEAVALVAVGVEATVVTNALLQGSLLTSYLQALTLFFCLWLAGKTRSAGLPLRDAGGAGFGIALFLLAPGLRFLEGDDLLFRGVDVAFFLLPCAVWIVLAFLYGRGAFPADKTRAAGACISAALLVLTLILCLTRAQGLLPLLPSLLFGVWAQVYGTLHAQLSAANFGIVNILALLLLILTQLEDFDLLPMGGMILFSGVTLLVVNKLLIKKFAAGKPVPAETAETEPAPPEAENDPETGKEATDDA